MSRAVLSIGSNLGDRLANLQSVLDGLGEHAVAVSAVYETAPWGPVEQDDFLNVVVIADDPDRDPDGWLSFAHKCEASAGRTRELHWGPRTLDVDVVDVDGLVSADPRLTLPHPRAGERAFVLVPWLDADPSARLGGTAVRELLDAVPGAELAGVRRFDTARLSLVSGERFPDTTRPSRGRP